MINYLKRKFKESPIKTIVLSIIGLIVLKWFIGAIFDAGTGGAYKKQFTEEFDKRKTAIEGGIDAAKSEMRGIELKFRTRSEDRHLNQEFTDIMDKSRLENALVSYRDYWKKKLEYALELLKEPPYENIVNTVNNTTKHHIYSIWSGVWHSVRSAKALKIHIKELEPELADLKSKRNLSVEQQARKDAIIKYLGSISENDLNED